MIYFLYFSTALLCAFLLYMAWIVYRFCVDDCGSARVLAALYGSAILFFAWALWYTGYVLGNVHGLTSPDCLPIVLP